MSDPGMIQIAGCTLHLLQAEEGHRGVLFEFQPHSEHRMTQPIRIALSEQQARELSGNIQNMLDARRPLIG